MRSNKKWKSWTF